MRAHHQRDCMKVTCPYGARDSAFVGVLWTGVFSVPVMI